MTNFVGDLLRISAGSFTSFSWVIWLLVTAGLALTSVILVGAMPRAMNEIAVDHARRPAKSILWGGATLFLSGLVMSLMVVTVVGIPVAMIIAIYLVGSAIFGYVALGMVWSDRLVRLAGKDSLNPFIAAITGVLVFRLLRLIPLGLGSLVQVGIFIASIGASTVLVWALALSWYNRRLPDNVQFKDDGVIEWPEDPGGSTD